MESYRKVENLDKLKKHPLTHATSNLGIWPNGKLVLYLG
ncbi:hypothetical protein J2X17_001382 [Flavobacterium aquidurense]|nr:hypothetical protein [Flavobacterium aquidurense]